MMISNGKGGDLDWFDARNRPSVPQRIAANLAIACVIPYDMTVCVRHGNAPVTPR